MVIMAELHRKNAQALSESGNRSFF